jgi:hypothetical protein
MKMGPIIFEDFYNFHKVPQIQKKNLKPLEGNTKNRRFPAKASKDGCRLDDHTVGHDTLAFM